MPSTGSLARTLRAIRASPSFIPARLYRHGKLTSQRLSWISAPTLAPNLRSPVNSGITTPAKSSKLFVRLSAKDDSRKLLKEATRLICVQPDDCSDVSSRASRTLRDNLLVSRPPL